MEKSYRKGNKKGADDNIAGLISTAGNKRSWKLQDESDEEVQ